MPEALETLANAAIAAKVFPGCVIGVARRGGSDIFAFGHNSYDAHARSTGGAMLYDLASITKSIPTASLALVLLGEKKLSLTTAVREYIPELKNEHGATLLDLLTYSVSGLRLSLLHTLSPERLLSAIMEHGFDAPPGARKYTNLPILLLGIVIERALGTSLDILARRYFFDPLKMADTAFFAGAPFARAAPTELDDWRGLVLGFTHDESAYILARTGRVSGHAGLFSTADDLLKFLSFLLQSSDERRHFIVEGAQAGLGWQVDQQYFMGSYVSPKTFGKTGFTGTSILVDIERSVGFVILSNRTYPSRSQGHEPINAFRSAVADIILADMQP